jgi:hypothetical protein
MPLGTHTNKEAQMPTTETRKRMPSPRQLRYLRDLAMQTGTSFVYPYTFGKAKSEIRRLIALKGQQRAARDANRHPDDLIGQTYELAGARDNGQIVDFDYAPDHALAA